MFQGVQMRLQSALMERVTLLLNHVVAAEPIAMARLQPHKGSAIEVGFKGWPALLPALPTVAYRVTPAGLLEWLGETSIEGAALRIEVDMSNPAAAFAQALTGARPDVEIAGDAEFAADVNWLIDNLRWDVEDDLARIVGAAPARELARLGSAIAAGLRAAVRTVGSVVGDRAGAPHGAEGPRPR
jgi:ubiquinone biosynthesis protein UbiJ